MLCGRSLTGHYLRTSGTLYSSIETFPLVSFYAFFFPSGISLKFNLSPILKVRMYSNLFIIICLTQRVSYSRHVSVLQFFLCTPVFLCTNVQTYHSQVLGDLYVYPTLILYLYPLVCWTNIYSCSPFVPVFINNNYSFLKL